MYIIQGDHGIPIPFTVQKLSASENLEGATVEVAIHRGEETFTKAATILNAAKGECSFTLTAADLTIFANYEWQWTAYFPDGRIYSGKTRKFNVSERLIAGSAGGETVPVIVPFARVEELEALDGRVTTLETEGTGGGSVLVFQTLADLQAAYPNGNNQPAWVATENDWYYWSGEIISDTTAPVLTITAGGTFTGTKSVTMSANETADIYYTLDGSTPTTSSAKYTSPLSISATTTLNAFAKDTAGNSSAVQIVTYTLDATPPADTTAPDNVTNLAYSSLAQTSLTLTWTASASSDVASYDVYNGATLLANVVGTTYNVSGLTASTQYTFTVKAKDAANNVASGTSVTVTTSAPADTTAPVLTITPAGTFTDTQTVTMSANETATIYYTLDDSDPKTSGTKLTYTVPLTLTETDTIKAYAKDTANNESVVQTITYTKSAPKQVVTSGLKVWFDGADGSGSQTTWTDKSTNANNATLTGFQFDTTDGWKSGGSLKGDGTDDYAKTASNLGITSASARTFQFKAKVNATDNKALMGIGGTTATTYMDILVYTGNICVYNGSATSIATIPFPVTVGDIVDVAVVYDGAAVTIYKNGVLLTGSYSVSFNTTDSPLTLLSGAGTSFKYSSNQLYYVAVYNRALSVSEIQANYDTYK
jgi:hypothetical protein